MNEGGSAVLHKETPSPQYGWQQHATSTGLQYGNQSVRLMSYSLLPRFQPHSNPVLVARYGQPECGDVVASFNTALRKGSIRNVAKMQIYSQAFCKPLSAIQLLPNSYDTEDTCGWSFAWCNYRPPGMWAYSDDIICGTYNRPKGHL